MVGGVTADPWSDEMTTSFESEQTRIYQDLIGELKKLDLSTNEAKILLFLMSQGSSTASDISRYTKIQRTDTYHYLSQLLSKGVAVTTFSKPQKYSALPFDQAVDSLVESKYQLLKGVLETKKNYQDKLEKIARATQPIEDTVSNHYQILGAESVFTRVKKGIEEADHSIVAYFSKRMLVALYHVDLMDEVIALTQKGVHVKLKTNELSSGTDFAESIFKLHLNQIADPLSLNFMIFDEKEMMIILEGKDSKDLSGIYTNNPALVATFRYLYERMT
jgi:HTH-type transcriptional regulator, sugar sensing transcriptional regulator